jgi:hypothetical protein
MHNRHLLKQASTLAVIALALLLWAPPANAQATNASLKGTYTFTFGAPHLYGIQLNMFGRQVGFCNGSATPFGYSCFTNLAQQVITGTLAADGLGNISSGSSFSVTVDPNESECSPNRNPVTVCPYVVPSGNAWSSTTAYVVGDVVDYQESNGKVLTFQAVKNNTNVAPVTATTAVCTAVTAVKNPPTCTWDQLFASATGNQSFAGTLTGTYSIQSNGAGVMNVTAVTSGGNIPVAFAIVARGTSSLGQVVPMVAVPQLGNDFRGSGSAVRIK